MDLKQAYCYLYPSCNQYPDTYLLKPIYTQNPTNQDGKSRRKSQVYKRKEELMKKYYSSYKQERESERENLVSKHEQD